MVPRLHSVLLKIAKRVCKSFFVFCEKLGEYYGNA